LVDLKHVYLTKKVHVIDRLAAHQKEIESFLKIYYDILDEAREEFLKREYELCDDMDVVEKSIKALLQQASGLSMVEFYNEQYEIQDRVADLKRRLAKFGTYLPEVALKLGEGERLEDIKGYLEGDIKKKLARHLKPIDQRFAMENYEYVTAELGSP